MNSWNKTCFTLQPKDQPSHDEQLRKNQEGQNVRLVILLNGKSQQEYFLKVKEIG